MFQFLDSDDKILLFRADEEGNTYHSSIDTAKSVLAGFFPYDFLAVDLLLQAFTDARDEDFKQAISTVEDIMLESHLNHCLAKGSLTKTKKTAETLQEEIVKVYKLKRK